MGVDGNGGSVRGDPGMRRLAPEDLGVVGAASAEAAAESLRDRGLLVLVGLTGAGKTTAVERLAGQVPFAALLPDRRALTDKLILPMMTGGTGAVADRVERFRLTAAFKERHPGGMGEVLGWLTLPRGLPAGPVLFDGLRGAAEVTAAAALPRARFAVLDCPPEGRLWRLCGRNDPFDQAKVDIMTDASADGAGAMRAVLGDAGFSALVGAAAVDRLAWMLADRGTDPSLAARSAAIIVEESRHYDPAPAREALLRLAPDRTMVLDTGALDAAAVVGRIVGWLDEK